MKYDYIREKIKLAVKFMFNWCKFNDLKRKVEKKQMWYNKYGMW